MVKINRIRIAWKTCLSVILASISSTMLFAQTITTNTQGTHDGFFYSFWNDNQSGSASMTLGPQGNYSTTWNNVHNFTAGKGWRTGSADRTVCFEGTYNGGSNGFLAVYGWTKDPLIEYYVVETHGQWTPPGNTGGVQFKGEYECDGSIYRAYTARRTNAPSIIGNADFDQYWSVRTNKRSTGTVPFATHVAAWRSFGMQMGTTWDYQIMESEGYTSSGNSNITVWECDGPGSNVSVEITAPQSTTPFLAPATVEIAVNASTSEGSITKVEFYNGTTKLGEDSNPPYTYTWNNVARGSYQITAKATDSNGSTGTSTAVNVRVNIPQAPYGGTAHAIPGTIEFEEFDEGGNNSAYFDDSPGSEVTNAPNFRTDEDVDIETCTDDGGGYNLGWTTTGEWTEYTVNVQESGTYDITIRAATETAKTISISSNGNPIASNIAIPASGGWQTWEDVIVEEVQLNAGEQVLRVTIGATDYVNLNKMTFTPHSISSPPVVTVSLPNGSSEFEENASVSISVTATSSQSTIASVELYVDNVLVGTDNSAPYSFNWSSSEVGTHTLRIVATDGNGETTSESTTVTITEAPISTTLALRAGWNLIGCPINTNLNVQDALSGIWSTVVIIKNEDSFYDKNMDPSLNSLNELQWGRGYFIYVSNDCELTW